MKQLSKGTTSECIFKLIKVMIDTQQQIYAEAMMDTEQIEDIADKIETDKTLFLPNENRDGTIKKDEKSTVEEEEKMNTELP